MAIIGVKNFSMSVWTAKHKPLKQAAKFECSVLIPMYTIYSCFYTFSASPTGPGHQCGGM